MTHIPELSSSIPVHWMLQAGSPRPRREGGRERGTEDFNPSLGKCVLGVGAWLWEGTGRLGELGPRHQLAGVMLAPLPPGGHFLWLQGTWCALPGHLEGAHLAVPSTRQEGEALRGRGKCTQSWPGLTPPSRSWGVPPNLGLLTEKRLFYVVKCAQTRGLESQRAKS